MSPGTVTQQYAAKPDAAEGRTVKKHEGMGPIPHDEGVAFRVWAPNADAMYVIGEFNGWDESAHPMEREDRGYWYASIAEAEIGQAYRYLVVNGEQRLSRIDPYAREVVNSASNAVIHDPHFDWGDDDFKLPPLNELVIYELHVGSFSATPKEPGGFQSVIDRIDHLKRLGVNVIELMPTTEFAGDYSWGYNPADVFAVESAYGGPKGLKNFVKTMHENGIGVLLDVVYNHFGPGDLSLWQFDGWQQNDGGGIYFYNDWRADTPWGRTRPDYGRGEVRQFIRDNAMMWLGDYRLDGLRFDMTLFIRSVRGDDDPGASLPEGWSLTQWINGEIRARFPHKITIAEDLQNNEWLTKSPGEGGAGFHSQWDARFVHPVRALLTAVNDEDRSVLALKHALESNYSGDAFRRVVYTESHDEVANGKARVPTEIDPESPDSVFAQQRSTLGAALALTAPGVPMLFQGQEFLQDEWFRDSEPLNWELRDEHRGIVRLYRDLILLRRNTAGRTRGLCGQYVHVYHLNELDRVLAYRRWDEGGPGDDVLVVVNLSNNRYEDYRVGFLNDQNWRLRFDSDDKLYSDAFPDVPNGDPIVERQAWDGMPCSASFNLAPYSVLIFSQD
ncbi:MAG: alpha amylase C-terminal domain-containing protein [Planctomycetales bacterium]|nr:alpha amylase C-terminal domain-containing protein [Planctomycetales bacterium]